ncbi:hypothetical protein BC940DRAFT_292777 [Gongronella butleri]|nr:hypothetical protein BC940DRAFT_292777 [Gongronella butleri]
MPSSTAQCTTRQLPRSRSVPSLRSHNLPPIVTTSPALHCPPLSFSHISSSSLSSMASMASMASSYNTQAPTTPDEQASPCDDHPLPHANTSSTSLSLKIKVKLHYKDTRVIKLAPTTCYQDLVQKVHEKLDIAPNDASAASLALSYKNKQQSLIILVNPGPNWCIADLLGVSFQRNPLVVDKIELWCKTHV